MKKIEKREIIIIVSIVLVIGLISVTGYAVWSDSKKPANSSNVIMEDNVQLMDNENIIEENTIAVENTQVEEEPLETLTEEQIKKEEVDVKEELKNNNTSKYYIKVNYKSNTITIYGKDENNEYTVPIKAMICSTGKDTPRSGVYKTSNKYRWHTLNGGVAGQYCTRIVGHILFHSVPYAEKYNPASLKYNAYDKLGTAASAGCIRVTVADAIWLYNNCASGTMVEFYASSNPGPLGKPSARKIASESSTVRGWDPTDPDPKNPWINYDQIKVAEQEREKQEALAKEEERKRQEEIAKKQAAEEEAKRLEEEKRKQEEEEKKQQEEEEKKKQEEEEKKQQEEEKNNQENDVNTDENEEKGN